MFLVALIAQFAHLSDDGHLVFGLDEAEVVEGSMHRGWVGIIGIHNQVVLLSNGHLTAVVRWDIILEGLTDLLAFHTEVDTYGDGCKQVVDVV